MSRESFNLEVTAKDYGFEPTDTPRTDRSVSLLDPLYMATSSLVCIAYCPSFDVMQMWKRLGTQGPIAQYDIPLLLHHLGISIYEKMI